MRMIAAPPVCRGKRVKGGRTRQRRDSGRVERIEVDREGAVVGREERRRRRARRKRGQGGFGKRRRSASAPPRARDRTRGVSRDVTDESVGAGVGERAGRGVRRPLSWRWIGAWGEAKHAPASEDHLLGGLPGEHVELLNLNGRGESVDRRGGGQRMGEDRGRDCEFERAEPVPGRCSIGGYPRGAMECFVTRDSLTRAIGIRYRSWAPRGAPRVDDARRRTPSRAHAAVSRGRRDAACAFGPDFRASRATRPGRNPSAPSRWDEAGWFVRPAKAKISRVRARSVPEPCGGDRRCCRRRWARACWG